jgi:serine phosphatase RsbU (regulator of sigma subunit)
MSRWRGFLARQVTRAAEWWRMPLIGLLVSGPISLTTSLFLASYGAEGAYGGFWRLSFAGMAASVPIFVLSGVFFAPVEIWLTRRPRRMETWRAGLLRSGVLALVGAVGAFAGYAIVVWALPTAPPDTLLPVFLATYPLDTAIVGLAYTLYDEYIYQLRVSTVLTQEMRVARSIQQGLFPRQSPQVEGYSLAALCQPARETGGDFFDFIELNEGRLGIIIADVSGKGMPAALFMANARSIWRAEARLGSGPAATLQRVNHALYDDMNSNGFVTCLYLILDPAARLLSIAGAGHPLPLLRDDAGIREIEVYGLPLGLQLDASYREVRLALKPGNALLLYTDGIIEAMDTSRQLFGLERLVDLFKREGDCSAEVLAERACKSARAFAGGPAQADDVTVIVLKLHGEKSVIVQNGS